MTLHSSNNKPPAGIGAGGNLSKEKLHPNFKYEEFGCRKPSGTIVTHSKCTFSDICPPNTCGCHTHPGKAEETTKCCSKMCKKRVPKMAGRMVTVVPQDCSEVPQLQLEPSTNHSEARDELALWGGCPSPSTDLLK